MNGTKLKELHDSFQKRLNDTDKILKEGSADYIADVRLEHEYNKAVINALENIYNEEDYKEFLNRYPELE